MRVEGQKNLLEIEAEKMAKEYEKMKEEIHSLTEVKLALKNKLKECRTKLEMTNERYEHEVKKVKELKEQSIIDLELNERKKRCEESLIEKEEEISQLEKEISQLKSWNRDQKETIEFLRQEKEIHESDYKSSNEKLKSELKEAKNEVRERLANLAIAEKKYEEYKEKVKSKDEKLAKLEKMLEKLESKIQVDLSNHINDEEVEKLKSELSLQRVEMRILEKKKQDLEERLKFR